MQTFLKDCQNNGEHCLQVKNSNFQYQILTTKDELALSNVAKTYIHQTYPWSVYSVVVLCVHRFGNNDPIVSFTWNVLIDGL